MGQLKGVQRLSLHWCPVVLGWPFFNLPYLKEVSMCQAFIYLKLSTVYIPFLLSTCCYFKPKQILERVKGREGVVGKGRWRVK